MVGDWDWLDLNGWAFDGDVIITADRSIEFVLVDGNNSDVRRRGGVSVCEGRMLVVENAHGVGVIIIYFVKS